MQCAFSSSWVFRFLVFFVLVVEDSDCSLVPVVVGGAGAGNVDEVGLVELDLKRGVIVELGGLKVGKGVDVGNVDVGNVKLNAPL